MQTEWWAAFKGQFGWQIERAGPFFGLARALPFGRSLLYFPELASEQRSYAFNHITQAKAPGRIFARLEFLEEWDEAKAAELSKRGLIKSFEDVQPEWRQWLDLTQDDETLKAHMKPKGRYNLKIAETSGLTAALGSSEFVADFCRLYALTAERTNFQGRGPTYFQKLVAILVEQQAGEVIVVKKGNEVLAAGIFCYFDGLASYLYGASGGDRSVMAPYLLHWTAIQEAKKRGCTTYDLLAVAPVGAGDSHPYAGLTRFKAQFGGRTVRLLGSWDRVYSGFWYGLYRFAERRRRKSSTT